MLTQRFIHCFYRPYYKLVRTASLGSQQSNSLFISLTRSRSSVCMGNWSKTNKLIWAPSKDLHFSTLSCAISSHFNLNKKRPQTLLNVNTTTWSTSFLGRQLGRTSRSSYNNETKVGDSNSRFNRVKQKTSHKIRSQVSRLRAGIRNQNRFIQEKWRIHESKGSYMVSRLRKRIQSKKENIKTIPNLLTTLRMISAPVLAYLVVNDHFSIAMSVFLVAGLTDLLDGYIARNFANQRTALGTALDPLADKLLISFLMISLTSADMIPVPMTVLILSRDAGLILGSFYIRYMTLSPPRTLSRYFDVSHVTAKLYPSTISKVNTGLQLMYVACTLGAPVFDYVGHPLLEALMYITATTTIFSGADYILTWRKRLKIVKND